ncbi:MAG: helix-hairpin-helix domain-containing protein [Actinomycetes bacterium]
MSVPVCGVTSQVTPSAAAGTVVVHVAGAVRKPGLVTLPAGARVADAIDKAGGARSPRYLASVNLARLLVDGEQIVLGESVGSGASAGKLSLGTATATELEQLPGVGPVLAQRIVQWRTENGPFRGVDDLSEVSGVGDALMEQLRPLVVP